MGVDSADAQIDAVDGNPVNLVNVLEPMVDGDKEDLVKDLSG